MADTGAPCRSRAGRSGSATGALLAALVCAGCGGHSSSDEPSARADPLEVDGTPVHRAELLVPRVMQFDLGPDGSVIYTLMVPRTTDDLRQGSPHLGRVESITAPGETPRQLFEYEGNAEDLRADATHVYLVTHSFARNRYTLMAIPITGGDPEIIVEQSEFMAGLTVHDGTLFWSSMHKGEVSGRSWRSGAEPVRVASCEWNFVSGPGALYCVHEKADKSREVVRVGGDGAAEVIYRGELNQLVAADPRGVIALRELANVVEIVHLSTTGRAVVQHRQRRNIRQAAATPKGVYWADQSSGRWPHGSSNDGRVVFRAFADDAATVWSDGAPYCTRMRLSASHVIWSDMAGGVHRAPRSPARPAKPRR